MDVVWAALAGAGARMVCHPLDTIKTVAFTGLAGDDAVMPGRVHPVQRTFRQSAGRIYHSEGWKGFYRGVGVAVVGSAPGVALYLTTYHLLSSYWIACAASTYGCADDGRLCALYSGLLRSSPDALVYVVCGLLSEGVSCLIWVPVDVSKERLQSQPPSLEGRYRSSWDALIRIGQYEGVRGLYRGYWSTLASFGPFSAIYFLCYEYLTRCLRRLEVVRVPVTSARESRGIPWDTFFVPLIAGAGGNIVASVFTNPLELVKTRLQVQRAVLGPTVSVYAVTQLFTFNYRGMMNGIATLMREEGVRALWRGMGCRIAYTAPNAALTMTMFECLRGDGGRRQSVV